MKLLTCNVGSTSLRMSAFAGEGDDRFELLKEFHGDYDQLDAALDLMSGVGAFDGIAHRIVHGGRYSLEKALALEPAVESAIEAARSLAPDHNGAALHVIHRCHRRFGPAAPQFAVFDSHFHAGIPPRAFRYSLPARVAQSFGIRRYGFHGLSHAYSAEQVLPRMPQGKTKHISVHAGGGVSITAIEAGCARDTSMGFTPLEGPVMATRSGSLDPGIIFELYRRGLSIDQIEQIVAHESGLLGLTGRSGGYGGLIEDALRGDRACQDALEIYNRSAAGEIARMAASLGGVDALSFTGGVGEHAGPFRTAVCEQLAFLGIGAQVPVYVISAREDVMLARACAWALDARHPSRSLRA